MSELCTCGHERREHNLEGHEFRYCLHASWISGICKCIRYAPALVANQKPSGSEAGRAGGAIALISMLLLIGMANSLVITGLADVPTKTENGLTVSTKPIYNAIMSNNLSIQYYTIKPPALTTGVNNINAASFKSKLGVKDADIYLVQSKKSWTQTLVKERTEPIYSIREICDTLLDENGTEYQDCRNETYQSGTTTIPATTRKMVNYTVKDEAKKMDFSKGEYLLAIHTTPFRKDSFNGTIGGRFFDPDIDACGELLGVETYTQIMDIPFNGVCFTMNGESSNFDGNSFQLVGEGTGSEIAFYITEPGLGITGVNIVDVKYGVYLDESGSGALSNSIITSSVAGSIGINNQVASSSFPIDNVQINTTDNAYESWSIWTRVENSILTSQTAAAIELNGDSSSYFLMTDVTTNSPTYGMTINTPQTNPLTMQLTANRGVLINANNTMLDCGGGNITGKNQSGTYGIFSNGFNTTIKNCNISNFATGVYLAAGASATITNTNSSVDKTNALYATGANVTITGGRWTSFTGNAIRIHTNSIATIQNMTSCYSSENDAVRLEGSTGNIIRNNNITAQVAGLAGIGLRGSANNLITDNTITAGSSSSTAISLTTTAQNNNTITNNTFSGQFKIGIDNSVGTNTSIDCNGGTLTGTNATNSYGAYSGEANTTVKNCAISNFQDAIRADNGANMAISNSILNTTHSSGRGIIGLSGSTVTATNITVYSGSGSMQAVLAQGTSMTLNQANLSMVSTSSQAALFQSSAGLLIIANSTIYASNAEGLRLGSSNNAVIYNTSITALGSSTYGIRLTSGANVSIDCAGKSIIGLNATSSYGVYSDQYNTTILNCNVSNFQHGISISGASSTITDSNASTTQNGDAHGIIMAGAGQTCTRCFGNSTGGATGNRIGIYTYGSNNQIINSTGATFNSMGIRISANNNTISGSTLTATGGAGSSSGLFITGVNNTITNSTITSAGYGVSQYLSLNNTLINDTQITAASRGVMQGTTASNNITISCNGKSITGANSSSYGVFVYMTNTVIRNCVISNFSTAMYYTGNTAGSIVQNTTASTTYPSGNGILIAGANGILINNSSFTKLDSGTNPLRVLTNSYNITIANSISTGGNDALRVENANTVTAYGNTFTGGAAVGLLNGTSCIIYNNTLKPISAGAALLTLDATSSGNIFYWNNFTATTGAYVTDLNGSNFYNNSQSGNIYANVMNHSIAVWGSVPATYGNGLYRGTSGTGVPYNNSTLGGKFICSFAGCADYVPLTDLGAAPYPIAWSFTRPYSYLLTYYANGSNITANWTNSTSPIGYRINCSVWTHINSTQARNDTIATNLSTNTLSAQLNTTGRNDLFYYLNGTCCDLSLNLCTNATGDIFGVYTPSVSVGFSAYASMDGQLIFKNNFTEYCQHTFYPAGTQANTSANLTVLETSWNMTVYSLSPATTTTKEAFLFMPLDSNTYYRQCGACNVYGNCSNSTIRSINLDASSINTQTAIEGQLAIFGSMIAFVVLAGAFAYLHTKTQNWVWRNIWIALTFVMAVGVIMGANTQANAGGDTTTAGITMVLFQIMFWILMVIMAIFSFNMFIGFWKLAKEAAYGKKT